MADDAVSLVPVPVGGSFQRNPVGVLGATSLVGACLLPLLTEAGSRMGKALACPSRVDPLFDGHASALPILLAEAGWQVTAYSRRAVEGHNDGVTWRRLPLADPSSPPRGAGVTRHWICVAPIWVLPEHFALLEAQGARRVVALSSTSRFTKDGSADRQEQAIALRLADAEARVQEWAQSRGVEWVILRPTLIYGLGRDKNITEIARFIRRFGFFPLFGKANGLRQPIHAHDVASACMAALQAPCAANRAYNLSGGETLSYHDMVARIFTALGRPPRLLPVPLSAFRVAVALLRYLPQYRHWSATMAERMNRDLAFDHNGAAQDLAFNPRMFVLSAEDVAT